MSLLLENLTRELGVKKSQVEAAVQLLDEGATVPFIARYRKEATQGLDDGQLRQLEERLGYLRDLESRREAIRRSIQEQGLLSAELDAQLLQAETKVRLEDLYRPYKPKRRTKAQIAREAGLAPLAEQLLAEAGDPESLARPFVNSEREVADPQAALEGARQILIEQLTEAPELLGQLREQLWQQGELVVKAARGKQEHADAQKFSDYFAHREPIRRMPSHRALAVLRGRQAGMLSLKLDLAEAAEREVHPAEIAIAGHQRKRWQSCSSWLRDTFHQAWSKKLQPMLETELVGRLREEAEAEAIRVFARNLKDLLLAAPAGQRCTLGLDPGLRTGVKATVVSATGKLLEQATFYPHAPKNQWQASQKQLGELCRRHAVELVSIGNGTASRETDRWVEELIAEQPDLKLKKIVVSEAGASVYSASQLAAEEFPDLDVSLRGAVSIARRLQDPLAELVKIDPKAIGVGQYQHDVDQQQLAQSLDTVVEDCVNSVGVDLNTASPALLKRVAGLTPTLARNIVEFREAQGAFRSRQQLLKVPRLGPKAFEQCAGFLRIRGGAEPLDASAVHPEAYSVVSRIAERHARSLASLIGDSAFLGSLNPGDYTDARFGVPTLQDILRELDKPGRDPRPEFRIARFQEGVERLEDLRPQMRLEGVVTNVTNFGAFVDIGVHQDGLVHISALADRFVKDPHEVVKAGDVVQVRVLEVDLPRRRIALSMRSQDAADSSPPETGAGRDRNQPAKPGARGGKRSGENRAGMNKPGKNKPGRTKAPTSAEPKTGSFGALLKAAQQRGKSKRGD